jgi:alanine dehydrogenase
MPRSYRIIIVKIAITSQILHNLGKTQYELRSVMRVGIPTEIKNNEFRVAITPAGVAELVHRGHEVIIQSGAGEGSAISDADFKRVGAQLINGADQVWAEAELLLKVKEPIEAEYGRMHKGQTLFTYLHLAASKPCTDALLASGTTSIAYETVQTADGALPLLAPMSEVAGRLSAQVGAYHMMRSHGGRGVLMGGVPGVAPADVVVIGGGTAGYNAARVAAGMGAHVTVFDLNINKLREVDAEFGGRIETRYSSMLELEDAVKMADLVIGAVLVPGAKAPKLVTNSTVAHMKPGAVLVDIAIDQGGCFEDSRPTTHDDPTFAVHETLFYCVANMPGAVPRTSTYALTNATMPYVLKLADKGWKAACQADPSLARGLSTHDGELLSEQVAADLDLPYTDSSSALA